MVHLQIRYDGGLWSELTTVTTDSTGDHAYSWTPAYVGSYEVKASWDGDGVYEGSASDTASLQVNKILTSISSAVSQSVVNLESPITISGSITPAVAGKEVKLTYQKPDTSSVVRTVVTELDGSYHDLYPPDLEGGWYVAASWDGDENYVGCISPSAPFTLDRTPPTISIPSPSVGSDIRTPDITITWSGTDDPSRIDHYETKLDEETWVEIGPCTSSLLTGIGDGCHTISIKAVDKAGNSKVEAGSFTVNTSLISGPGWIDDIAVFGGIGIVLIIGLLLLSRRKMSMEEWCLDDTYVLGIRREDVHPSIFSG